MKRSICGALSILGLLCASCSQGEAISETSALAASPLASTVKTLAYVEVNSNDFDNVGCYVYGSPAKEFFNMASIFAANINYDDVQKKPVLYFNPNVDHVLNGTNYVKDLQSKGIKVFLTVLGNHENAGWACFTDENTATDFASQLANAVSTYGLDGIDIDDEYSACTTNDTSLIVVASKMRAAMPNKIISKALFSDQSYFTATWNGRRLADYLDYGWEMTYGWTDYASRLSPYLSAGMTKAKLGIGASTDGSDGASAATYVKNNGIGTLMTFNVTNGSTSYLTGQSNVLFSQSTKATSNCLK